MDRPPPCQVGRPRPQRAVARGREPERRFEGAGKVRLIGKSRLTRHVDEWALLMDPVPREGEPTHEQVTMGARTQHDPELDRKSTRLNSSHLGISYAVFCLKKKIKYEIREENHFSIRIRRLNYSGQHVHVVDL